MTPNANRHRRVRTAHQARPQRQFVYQGLANPQTKRREITRIGRFTLLYVFATAAIGATCWVKPAALVGIWSAITSPAIGAALFAIAMSLSVCGALAAGLVWWVCRRELQVNLKHQAAMRRHLAMTPAEIFESDCRRAA